MDPIKWSAVNHEEYFADTDVARLKIIEAGRNNIKLISPSSVLAAWVIVVLINNKNIPASASYAGQKWSQQWRLFLIPSFSPSQALAVIIIIYSEAMFSRQILI